MTIHAGPHAGIVSHSQSVSYWIEQIRSGDEQAAQALWQRYYRRLLELARHRLQGASRRVADEEDVVVKTFGSVFRRFRNGEFPNVCGREELWFLLIRISQCKASNQRRDQRCLRRGRDQVLGESALEHDVNSGMGCDALPGDQPTPDFVVAMAESIERLLDVLNEDLRDICLLKLAGHTSQEIATLRGRSIATIERRLRLIRKKWNREMN